jgi:hypothetical protein
LPAALLFFACVSVVAGIPAFVGSAVAGTPQCVPALAMALALLLSLLLFCVAVFNAVDGDLASAEVSPAVDFYACCLTEQIFFP